MFWLLEKFLRWFYTMPLDDKDLLKDDKEIKKLKNRYLTDI
jgi:hypothetical protein